MALYCASESEGGEDKMADYLGPGQVDQFIRQALQFCWMCLPKEKRTPDELERQFRRLVDRALKDFKEDRSAFGKTDDAKPLSGPSA